MNAVQARMRLVQAGAVFAAAVLIAGCGSEYRSPITPINTNGPAAQPASYVAVVSAISPTSLGYNPNLPAGYATILDYSGDTTLASVPITSLGVIPQVFTVDSGAGNGYTINSDGTMSNFPVSGSLTQKSVGNSTLFSTSQPVNLFSPATGLLAPDQTGSQIDVFASVPPTLQRSIPVATTPVFVAGPASTGQRYYSVSLNSSSVPAGSGVPYSNMTCNANPTASTAVGEADAIEIASYTISARIPLGKCPVYAVQSPDNKRLFILNRGDDTITVINTQTNALDACTPFTNQAGQPVTCHPRLPLSTAAVAATGLTPVNGTAGMKSVAGPVYAEYNVMTNQLVVADYDGGTVSVIDVSLDVYGNDSPTFGTTYTIPVGKNPASVTALYDGSRAYTADQQDQTVTIVNLANHTVEKTLPVIGHPRTVASTQNSQYGKVYVGSPDSPYVTVIRTDLDVVDTSILLQGIGNTVDLRVSSQNGGTGNSNYTSRRPGAGQPCNLPGAAYTASLTLCQQQP